MITVEELKQVLSYDPETGVFTYVDDILAGRFGKTPCARAGDIAGGIGSDGYRKIKLRGRSYRAHRLAWLYCTGRWPRNEIDHINGIADDNRWKNLREATRAENNCNRKTSKLNSTGVKGVYWHKKNKCYCADIRVNGKKIYLGSFSCPTAAHLAYCKAAKAHFGEFARTE